MPPCTGSNPVGFAHCTEPVSSDAELTRATNSTKKQWQGHNELKCRFPDGPTKTEPRPPPLIWHSLPRATRPPSPRSVSLGPPNDNLNSPLLLPAQRGLATHPLFPRSKGQVPFLRRRSVVCKANYVRHTDPEQHFSWWIRVPCSL